MLIGESNVAIDPAIGGYGVDDIYFSDISFGMCLCLMSWVQQVHSAAVVARSLRVRVVSLFPLVP